MATKKLNRGTRLKRPHDMQVGEVQVTVARWLERYNRLTPTFLSALSNQKIDRTQKHLQSIKNDTHNKSEHYVSVQELSLNNEFIYRAEKKLRTYAGAPQRATLLSFNGGSRSAEHDLMVSTLTASIELGMIDTPYSLFTPEEIMRSPDFKGSASGARHKFSIMVENAFYEGKLVKPFELIPDNVFGIEGPRGTTFYALECEHTNTVASKSLHNNSVLRKMIGYDAISKRVQGTPLYTKHWGLPNLMVIFVKDTQAQLDTLMETLAELVAASTQMIFKPFPIMKSARPYYSPKPTPTTFHEPWQRVGHPPFSMLQ